MKFSSKKAIAAEQKLSAAYGEVIKAKKHHEECQREMAEVLQELFEEKVKKGDRVLTMTNVAYIYVGIRFLYGAEVICNPLKKDGTPSKAVRYVPLSQFVNEI